MESFGEKPKEKKMNWSKILSRPENVKIVREFAEGLRSKNDTMYLLAFNPGSGELNTLIRSVGTTKARQLAKQALNRRSSTATV